MQKKKIWAKKNYILGGSTNCVGFGMKKKEDAVGACLPEKKLLYPLLWPRT